MKRRIVWFSDIHLGLKTSDIDRTEEIVHVSKQAIKRACSLHKKGYEVLIVIGGDVFQHNDPNDYLMSMFIKILNPAVKLGITIKIVVGNHDAIANPKKKSCFESIKKLKGGYEVVEVIDDFKTIHWFDEMHLTFFPHITKAHLEGTDYKTTQDYIDGEAMKMFKKIGPGQRQFVFSHLNVPELIPGSEENLLKKSEAWLPECYMGTEDNKAFMGSIAPVIVQAHIHTKQRKDNVHVIGAPLYCDFGEKEKKKFYAVIKITEAFDKDKDKILYKQTDCYPFVELTYDLSNGKEEEISAKAVRDQIRGAIVKVNVILDGHAPHDDWEKLRKSFQQYAHYVKPIVPTYMKKRVVRNEKQSISLDPLEASRTWMKKNKPKNRKRKLQLVKDYIEGAL